MVTKTYGSQVRVSQTLRLVPLLIRSLMRPRMFSMPCDCGVEKKSREEESGKIKEKHLMSFAKKIQALTCLN